MRKLIIASLIALAGVCLPLASARAQSTAPVLLPSGCGTGNLANNIAYPTVNSVGQWCDATSVAGFQPSASGARGTPVTVTTSDSSGTLPTGAVVVSNVGANPMYCNVNGVAATTSDQYISTGGGWFSFTIPSGATALHCIATGGSTTANMVGGSGLPTGTGGGGGGGGGTVAQGNKGTNAQAWWVELGDGTNGPAAVKPASTAPVATDPALVVSLSPNSAGIITPGQELMAASAPVAIASDQSAFPIKLQGGAGTPINAESNASSGVATGSANLPMLGYMYGFDGTTWDQLQVDGSKNLKVAIASNATVTVDPCAANAKTSVAISQTANAKIFSATSAKKNYICSYLWNGSDAENISLVEGTGSTCGTNTAAIVGGTTAAAGNNFAANSGASGGNGQATVVAGNNANYDVCLFQSGSGRVAGYLTYVQQ